MPTAHSHRCFLFGFSWSPARGLARALVGVLWLSVAMPGRAQAQEELAGKKVASVEFHLPPGLATSGIAELIALRAGQAYSTRLVRRSIERLYATNKFADVVVRTVPNGDRLNVIFELLPKQRVATVDVGGSRVIPAATLLEAIPLRKEEEYYPERLADSVRVIQQLYQRRGYDQAKVWAELQELDEGLQVSIQVEEGPPTRVRAVTVAGTPGLPLPQILRTAGIAVGDVLDLQSLQEGLERVKTLFRDQGYYQAHVFEPEVHRSGLEAQVALPISAGPKFRFVFHGNRSFPDPVLTRVLDYDGTESLNRALSQRMARRLEGFYRYRGYYDVQVRPREVESPDGRNAVLSFDIQEGRVLRVREARFDGNHVLSDAELKTVLAEQVSLEEPAAAREGKRTDDPTDLEGRTQSIERSPPPEVSPADVFVEEAYAQAAVAMEDLYRERGFQDATVRLANAEIDVEARMADVRFEVVEGPQTLIHGVRFHGLPSTVNGIRVVKLLPGMPLGMGRVEGGRQALLTALRRNGYLFASAVARPELAADKRSAVVWYQVAPGPEVHVGRIIVQGLARTEENVVRANLEVREGDILDPDELYESQRNLVLLGIFRHAAVRLLAPDTIEPTKDVVVELKERARLSGEVSGGYSPVDGPRTFFDAVYPNMAGLGINLSLRAKLNYVGASAQALNGTVDPAELQGINGLGGRLNLSTHWPRIYSLLPARIGARLELIAERVRRSSFQFTRYASIVGFDWSAARWLTLGLQYEIEHDQIAGVRGVELLSLTSNLDVERLRFPEGAFNLHSFRLGPTLDFRDDPINPRKGLLIAGTAELTQDLGATIFEEGQRIATRIFTLKVFGNVSLYVPLASRVVLALSTRAGTILPIVPESRTIAPKRFFLGGAATMRGFREDALLPADRRGEYQQEVRDCSALANRAGCTQAARDVLAGREIPSEGGEAFALGKAELRFPISSSVDLGLFAEAGNLWLNRARVNLFDLRSVAGVGVRFGTPIGPLAFDTGFNLFPDDTLNEQRVNFHFTIGLF